MSSGRRILEIGKTAPPASPAAGDLYVTGASPTGAWSGKASKLALAIKGGGSPVWLFGDPIPGERHFDANTEREVFFDGTNWYAIVSPWQADYGAATATADGATTSGRNGSTSTNQAGTLPSGYEIRVTSVEGVITMGATAGTHTVYLVLRVVGGTDVRMGTAFTAAENVTVRDWRFGSLLTPLAAMVGDGSKRAIVGWENASGGSKALAASLHYVSASGYLLRKLT